ncbi:hypothetical protein [Planobispora takensis]|nr:hypothetical protein [Planobispora takensis]
MSPADEKPDSPAARPGSQAAPDRAGGSDDTGNPHDGDEKSKPRGDNETESEDVPLSRRIQAEEQQRRLRAESLETLYGEDVRSSAGRDWIGDSSYRVSGGGSVYRADTIYLHDGAERSGVRIVRLEPDRASRLLRCLVVTDSQERLVKALDDEPVAFLYGSAESGWKTTAIAALLTWSKASGEEDRVPVAQLGLANDPARLAETDLETGLGYLIDASSSPWVRDPDHVVACLRELARARTCRIVILVTGEHRLAGVVDHLPPSAEEVFRKSLAHCLDDADAWRAYGLDEHAATVADLVAACTPGEAAYAAERVAEGLREGRPATEVLQEQPRFAERRLCDGLRDSTSMLSRCFLASGAVLHGLPEVTVSRAALELAALVRKAEDRKKDEGGIAVWEQLRDWMRDGGLSSPPSRAGDGQRVELRRGLAPAVLRLIWQELPVIRSPLYTWLKALGEAGARDDWQVRLKAAHAVGRLATCDFREIDREFLDPWSRDRRLLPKILAAWALEAAAADPQLLGKVHGQLQQWAASELAGQRLTAALAYGSQIGVDNIGQALRAFGAIALTATGDRLCDAVARSIADVYVTETAGRIVTELATWARDHENIGRRLTAALAFVRLLSVNRHNPERPSPADHPDRQELADLWLNALGWGLSRDTATRSQPPLTPEAWDLLTAWATRSPAQAGSRAVVEAVFSGMGSIPRLSRAGLLHLRLWRFHGRVTPEFCRHLTHLMKGS